MKQLNLIEIKTKRCNKCGEVKPESEFRESKNRLRGECKECEKKYRQNNSEKVKERQKRFKENNPEYSKNYYQENKENILKIQKEYRKNNSEKIRKYRKEYYKNNLERIKEIQREWAKNNPEKLREKQKRFLLILKNRLNCNISNLIYQSLKGNKNNHWENLVGYTLQDLMAHLEKLFKPGMNWENYGEWHIDHIRPISSFNFNSYNDPEFKECWALENLQPLWESENLSKGANFKV